MEEIEELFKVAQAQMKHKKTMIPEQDADIKKEVACVQCEDIGKLAQFVADIIKQMPINKERHAQLEIEAEKLKAIAIYTEFSDTNGDSYCFKDVPYGLNSRFKTFEKRDLRFVFEDLETDAQFDSAVLGRMKSGKKTVYFRGTENNAEKIIKVEINPNGKHKISYYTLAKMPRNAFIEHEMIKLPELGDGKSRSPLDLDIKNKDIYGYKSEYSWNEDSENSQMKFGAGLAVEDYVVPQDIVFAKVESQFKVTDSGYNIDAKTDIGIRDRNLDIKLRDAQNQSMARMTVNKDGQVYIGLPLVTESKTIGMGIKSHYSMTTSGHRNLRGELFTGDDKAQLVSFDYSKDSKGKESIAVERDFTFNEYSYLKIKYKKNKGGSSLDELEGKEIISAQFYLSF